MQVLKLVGGSLFVALCTAGCSQEHGKELAKAIGQKGTVKFNIPHYGCLNTDILIQAESFQSSGQNDRFASLIREGKCELLPADMELTVVNYAKEDEDSVVVGVVRDSSKLSVEFFTRYRGND